MCWAQNSLVLGLRVASHTHRILLSRPCIAHVKELAAHPPNAPSLGCCPGASPVIVAEADHTAIRCSTTWLTQLPLAKPSTLTPRSLAPISPELVLAILALE